MDHHNHILYVDEISRMSLNGIYTCARLTKETGVFVTYCLTDEGHFILSHHEILENYDENFLPYSEEDDNYIEKQKENFLQVLQKIYLELGVPFEFQIEYFIDKELHKTLDFLKEHQFQFDFIVTNQLKVGFFEKLFFHENRTQLPSHSRIPVLFMPTDVQWRRWIPNQTVIAINLEPRCKRTAQIGAKIAIQLQTKSIHLLHVMDETISPGDLTIPHLFPINYAPVKGIEEELKNEKKEKLEHLKSLSESLKKEFHFQSISYEVIESKISKGILQSCQDHSENNLLIMGTHQENFIYRFFVGNKTEEMESECELPMLVIPERDS